MKEGLKLMPPPLVDWQPNGKGLISGRDGALLILSSDDTLAIMFGDRLRCDDERERAK